MLEILLTAAFPLAVVSGECYVGSITTDQFKHCECLHIMTGKTVCPVAKLARTRFLQWERRLAAYSICELLCKHNPHCYVIKDIPEFINPPEYADWEYRNGAFHSADNSQIITGTLIKNPDFTHVAYGTREPEATSNGNKSATAKTSASSPSAASYRKYKQRS